MEITVDSLLASVRDVYFSLEPSSSEKLVEIKDDFKIQVHPCEDRETIAVLPNFIPKDATEIKSLVCTENDNASAIEYAMAIIDVDCDVEARYAICQSDQALSHSGWHRVEKNQAYNIKLELPDNIENEYHLVLATRLPDDGYKQYGWARWLDFGFTSTDSEEEDFLSEVESIVHEAVRFTSEFNQQNVSSETELNDDQQDSRLSTVPINTADTDLSLDSMDESVRSNFLNIFDSDFYYQQLQQHNFDNPYRIDNPIEHFLNIGWKKLISPSPVFDVEYYLNRHRGIRKQNINPLLHYLTEGDRNGANPHPLFNVDYYRQKYEIYKNTNTLSHFLTKGYQQGLNPSPVFLTKWYTQEFLPKPEAAINPLIHYCLEGFKINNDPNPLFNGRWYLQQNPDVKQKKLNPLIHYLIHGSREKREPSPLFDSAYYKSQLNIGLNGISPLEHYMTAKVEVSPCQLFDVDYYRQHLTQPVGFDKLLMDYVEKGWRRHQDPHPFFRTRYYLEYNPDVAQIETCPLSHFLESGYRENRSVNQFFNLDFYKKKYFNVLPQDTNETLFYLQKGSQLNHQPNQPDQVRLGKRPENADQSFKLSKSKAVLTPLHKQHSLGVFAHIFYADLVDEVIDHTNNIEFPNCTIYISTNELVKANHIKQRFTEKSKHEFEIRVLPNRGRDIAPMIIGYQDRLREVDFGVHIHTKRSKHYGKTFDRWREYLYEQNLGSSELVDSIVALLADHNLGVVFPQHYPALEKQINWGTNLPKIQGLIDLMGHKLNADTLLELPSGSMFWFRSDALKPLLDIGLTLDMFNPEAGQIDGTLAHAIERSFLYTTEIAGYDWLRVSIDDDTEISPEPLKLLEQHRQQIFPTASINKALVAKHPELTPFHFSQSHIEKPRINLLIPTSDTSQAYAGVSTALDVFLQSWKRLEADFDVCIINTDTPTGNQYVPPKSFEMLDYGFGDRSGLRAVVNANVRNSRYFQLRCNDIFVATSWWSAHHALAALEKQTEFFGARDRKFVYLIQDYESCFYPWSSRFMYCDATYLYPEKVFPMFNTGILADFMMDKFDFGEHTVLDPGINPDIAAHVTPNTKKKHQVLLYYRPHAERNCGDFLEAVVEEITHNHPDFHDWEFLAIGEDVAKTNYYPGSKIKHLGRLTLEEYGELISESALAISLMVSPHPSYPPLEMADGGVLVIANNYANKDLSELHENIYSFDRFIVSEVAQQLQDLLDIWQKQPNQGWEGKPLVDWFFNGQSNLEEVTQKIADYVDGIN